MRSLKGTREWGPTGKGIRESGNRLFVMALRTGSRTPMFFYIPAGGGPKAIMASGLEK